MAEIKKEDPGLYILKSKYYDKVEKTFDDPKKEREFIVYVSKYRDKYISIFSSPYIQYNSNVFSETNRQFIFNLCDISEEEVQKTIKSVPLPGQMTVPLKEFKPFYVVLILCLSYAVKKNKTKLIPIIAAWYAYYMYPLLVRKYYRLAIRQETMEYTINNMTKKFKIKKMGSIEGMIIDNIMGSIRNGIELLKRCSDDDLMKFNNDVYSRENNMMRNIASEYKRNYEDNKAIFQSVEMNEDGTFIDRSGDVGTIGELAEKYTTIFFSTPTSKKILALCSSIHGVSGNELRAAVDTLKLKKSIEDVKMFYKAIFTVFLTKPGNRVEDVHSVKFLAVVDDIYKKGNTSDQNIIDAKKLTHVWLNEASSTYRNTKRSATANAFRKALFNYFTFTVTMTQ